MVEETDAVYSNELTESQKRFVEELELKFEHRYTDKDEIFVNVSSELKVTPPIIEPWYKFSRNRRFRGDRNYERRRDDNRDDQNSYKRRHDNSDDRSFKRQREDNNSRDNYRPRNHH